MNIENNTFYVYWLSFKDGRKQLCSCLFFSREMAENYALLALSFYDDLDLLDDEFPFYIACYEY